jgi:hypothetical protein
MGWDLDECGSWGIAYCDNPATEMAAVLALPGSWPMGAQPSAFVRNDQWKNIPTGPTIPPVAGYTIWYDASQMTGLADGAKVATWADVTGPNTLTQATPANQPAYFKTTAANLINGHPAVKFDGTTSFMVGPASQPVDHPQPVSFVFVCQPVAVPSGNAPLLVDNAYTGTYAVAAVWGQYAGANASTSLPVTAGTSYFLVSILNGATSTMTANATTSAAINPGTLGYATSSQFQVAKSPSNIYFSVLIGEMLAYPFLLSPAQITSLRTYAQSKWGTP